MDFTTEQELALLFIGWIILIAAFKIWNDYGVEKKYGETWKNMENNIRNYD